MDSLGLTLNIEPADRNTMIADMGRRTADAIMFLATWLPLALAWIVKDWICAPFASSGASARAMTEPAESPRAWASTTARQ